LNGVRVVSERKDQGQREHNFFARRCSHVTLERPGLRSGHLEDTDALRQLAFDADRNENRELPFFGKPDAARASAHVPEKAERVGTSLVRVVLNPERLLVRGGWLGPQRRGKTGEGQAEPESTSSTAPHLRQT
jgi:hypothetical protein